jgi:type IV pilus assembly protein PilW
VGLNQRFLNSSNAAGVAGFSLVELMVSITIGLILLLGLVTLLVNSSASHSEMQKSSAQIENGRYATQLLGDDIQLAGYYGEYKPTAYDVPEKPCVAAVTPVAPNMPSPVGYDLTATAVAGDFACLTNLQGGTGVLVLRRVQTVVTTPAPPPATVTGATYLQVSQCNSDASNEPFKFLVADATPSGEFTLRTIDCDSTKPAALRKFIVHIYYISSCNECAPSDGIPTLKLVEYADGAAQAPVALVEGIEDMQFDYGIDADNDGSPDSYVAAPVAAADWANVMAIRINLLARNILPTAYYNDSKTYALGLAKPAYTVPSGVARTYKRHAYTSVVRVENPSARRETP